MDTLNGYIHQSHLGYQADCLYRLSLKALIVDDEGKVLVVKESGRASWDMPGGGMDHDESIKEALSRELLEEVNFKGDFTHAIFGIEEPVLLKRANLLQVRLIFKVTPDNYRFSAGDDADEVAFMNPNDLKNSTNEPERLVYNYFQRAMLLP